MAAQRPGKGKPFSPGKYSHGGHSLNLAADGGLKVKSGDTVSRLASCLYKDPMMGWEEFGREVGGNVKRLDNVNTLRVGETIYHMPTHAASPAAAPAAVAESLLFDGKHLQGKSKTGSNVFSFAAVSGLRSKNKTIDKLIAAGRTDIKKGTDYTDSKYQNVTMAGPIPEGEYYLPLTKDMKFEKTTGGWGTGGWQIHNVGKGQQILAWLDTKLSKEGVDLPGVRSGFFLHHDGGNDGTAGCIGITKSSEVLKLQKMLVDLHKAGHKRIPITVKY